MPVIVNSFTPEIIQLLTDGKIGVIRTDTLYGVVARSDSEAAVERVYRLKHRTITKSPIILIGSLDQLFDHYDQPTLDRVALLWPGKNSVILPATNAPEWITRGNGSVAYRMPDSRELREFLAQTGPLIAPSANPEGETPAMTVDEAVRYFGDNVDFYVDGGTVTDDAPSKLYRLQDEGMERLR